MQNSPDKELLDILERYTNGIATPQERERIISWFESLESDSNTNADDSIKKEIGSRIWTNLYDSVQYRRKSERKLKTLWYSLGVAASVAVLILSIIFYKAESSFNRPLGLRFDSANKKYNSSLVDLKYVLQDGSIVTLKPGSSISYNDFTADKRIVELKGEALFDVAHDKNKPFVVKTGKVVTTVLGTIFNIKAPSDTEEIVVSVLSGKVRVSNDNDHLKEVILTPNQQAIFDPVVKKISTSVSQTPVPVKGSEMTKTVFEEEPIVNILEETERMYGIDIIFDPGKLAGCKVTTSFKTEGLFEKLDILTTAIGATYSTNETSIVIESNGCD